MIEPIIIDTIQIDASSRIAVKMSCDGSVEIVKEYKNSFSGKWAWSGQTSFEPNTFNKLINALQRAEKLLLLK